MRKIMNFLRDEDGLEMSEYAIATALVALALVTAFTNLGTAISGRLAEVVTVIGNIN